MRIKTTAAVVAFAIVGAIAISVTGQEEALPPVRPKTSADAIPLAAPTVVLAVEPIRDLQAPTLIEAARSNDYITFDALFTEAKKRGEDVSPFATLHDLWTYSVTDPIGAFYGRDLYERLNRAYPGYAAYIADYRIVDSRGNVFYPTSETRSFLIDRIIEGRTPRVVIASSAPRARVTTSAVATTPARVVPASTPAPRRARSSATAAAPAANAPAPAAAKAPVVEQPAPAATPVPAPAVAAATAPVSTPAVPAATTPAPEPVAVVTPATTAAPQAAAPAAEPQRERPLAGRGLVLLFIGLIGIGLLALILRTPREEPIKIVQPPPANNVEPMRKPQAAPKPPAPDTPRATGSHG